MLSLMAFGEIRMLFYGGGLIQTTRVSERFGVAGDGLKGRGKVGWADETNSHRLKGQREEDCGKG